MTLEKTREMVRRTPIQAVLTVSFSILTIFGMIFLGTSLYHVFSTRMEQQTSDSSEKLVGQAAANLESYLKNLRNVSDTIYYSVIKDTDLAEDNFLTEELSLLYEANKDNLISIACYYADGSCVDSVPFVTEKEQVDVREQDWFQEAMGEVENLHFSTPHVQNLFDISNYRYDWVVSLSRAVELNENGKTSLGVLVIDLDSTSIQQIFDRINENNSMQYFYLMDQNGNIIYHPRYNLIQSQLYEENNNQAVSYRDGTTMEEFQEEKRMVTVKTISYTGWKIVCVTPQTSLTMSLFTTRYFAVLLVAITAFILLFLNQLLSVLITRPIRKLTKSIQVTEDGTLGLDIYVGGSQEVEYLGLTLRKTAKRLKELMDDVVYEQEEKRKSELDALQSQINPHFLYNTLDSIVWMIEGERYREAVYMITQLASLFRISLSKGKTIIRLEEELQHAKNYMNIQQIRYKNSFQVDFRIPEELYSYCTVKLILQPILENAIYYAMEGMDGEGEILVSAKRTDTGIDLFVSDNGFGMPKDVVEHLLDEEEEKVHAKGSGVGLINIHKRLRLRFGEDYGLEIQSEPDEGTTVILHLPVILYEDYQKQKEAKRGEK